MSKRKGGMGFRNLYGFNIALLGKHVWNFLHNPDALVTRLYKAKYFPHSNVLKAKKGVDPIFIWAGIWTAKEELSAGFRWIVGDGNDVVEVKDAWLRKKSDFRVDNSHIYEGRSELVSSLFIPNSKQWDVVKVQQQFLKVDAEAILAIRVPNRDLRDRIVWAHSTNGVYSAKSGYHF